MSFNVEGLSAAKQQLFADLSSKHQCAHVCMQETHRGPNYIRPNVPGMDLAIERPNAQFAGSPIIVRDVRDHRHRRQRNIANRGQQHR